MNQLISVIMPAYNAALYLPAAVESVRRQTYKNWELIIADDGSADTTPELLRQFSATDARIRILHQENAGASAARNTGMAHAAGDLIYFMDSDDTIVPEALEKIAGAFSQYDVDIVEFGFQYVNARGETYGGSSPKLDKALFTGDEVRDYLLAETIATSPERSTPNGLTVYNWSAAYTAKFLRSANWQLVSEREYIYEDYYSRLQLFGLAQRVAILPDRLYNYYIHAGSLMQRYQPDRFARVRKLYGDALALCEERGYSDTVKKRVSWFFICNVNVAIYAMLQNVTSAGEQRRQLREIANDGLFIKAVNEWKDAKLPRSRKLLFAAYRSRDPLLLRALFRHQLKKFGGPPGASEQNQNKIKSKNREEYIA